MIARVLGTYQTWKQQLTISPGSRPGLIRIDGFDYDIEELANTIIKVQPDAKNILSHRGADTNRRGDVGRHS